MSDVFDFIREMRIKRIDPLDLRPRLQIEEEIDREIDRLRQDIHSKEGKVDDLKVKKREKAKRVARSVSMDSTRKANADERERKRIAKEKQRLSKRKVRRDP